MQEVSELDEESEAALGQGRSIFTRAHKRLCGFVFLRTLRTGTRALSLQRGSLLDTVLKLAGTGTNEMWQDTLERLRTLEPAIGEIDQLKTIREEIRVRLGQFVGLAPGSESTAFFASDLTREHLREVVRLFIAAEPGQHPLPFGRLGTGSINLLVFALLTFIAELKGKKSVIFAMEEPEIALPPHTQRRLTRFVLENMGQSIVTSHSPYVIGQFEPSQIVMLERAGTGVLSARLIDTKVVPTQKFRTQRHQFAEAILSRAVLVVEGATEATLFPVASSVMDDDILGSSYTHFDIAGVTVFNATTESLVPQYGPIFSDLGKLSFAFYDKPNTPFGAEAIAKMDRYTNHWESPEKGIETLLVKEVPIAVIRRFLAAVNDRSDYPPVGAYDPAAADNEVTNLALKVLKARKGEGHAYAALLIEQCRGTAELPATIRKILEAIHHALTPPALPAGPQPAEAAPVEPA